MLKFLAHAAMAIAVLSLPLSALAAEPVKRIDVYVQPYYEAARTPAGRPQVAVGERMSKMLRSNRREDILAARDAVAAEPGLITPMTMMVLAIRLYDVGLRDDAVFWFYVAKDRFITLADVIDIKASGMASAEEAVRAFAELAGPFINGYAFCDVANQQAQSTKAVAWVERNPYDVIFMDRFTAKLGNRGEALKASVLKVKSNAEKVRAFFENPNNLESFNAGRKKNGMDAKFCWN